MFMRRRFGSHMRREKSWQLIGFAMRMPALLLIASLPCAMAALAQPADAPARPALVPLLNVAGHQWVLHHICVPLRLPGPAEYTNTDYVNAYLDVSKSRWDASMAALEQGDEKRSMSSLWTTPSGG